jgi:hypothetical protein
MRARDPKENPDFIQPGYFYNEIESGILTGAKSKSISAEKSCCGVGVIEHDSDGARNAKRAM